MPPRPYLIATAAVVLVMGLACGGFGPAPHEDPPEEKAPLDAIAGTWEGGDRTIEFRDDGTFTLTPADREEPGTQAEGTWKLCDTYPFEDYHDGQPDPDGYACEEAGAGEWIQLDFGETGVQDVTDFTDTLFLTGDDELKMYIYEFEEGVLDGVFYEQTS
ncbi:hypothetical protein [Glycomyces sp. NPDC048151]|uniref:hypothetical protein n=1 Tax=Glycomyces sp. NPDC048151 TaxID=3364002 RepID=UPI003714DEEF